MDFEMLKRITITGLCVWSCAAVPALAGQAVPPAAPAAAAAPAPEETVAPVRQGSSDYIIGAQDVLKINVFGENDLSGSFKVDSDGTIQYPFLGRVAVGGESLTEVSELLQKRLETGFVRRAQVVVDIEQYRVRNVSVMGEVRTPGKYPMGSQLTLIEALAAAGSTAPTAGGDVLILRAPTAATANATPEERTIRISLADLQVGRENVVLQEGDTIFVQKAEKFFITGQVKSPGAFTYERNLTVLQALALAGGLSEKGSNRRIKVIRIVDGKQVTMGIDLDDTIQPGDTIIVAQRLL
jgi:polysaccharide export outer membrane protein